MNWRWKIRNTIRVGREDQQRAGAQQRDVRRVVTLERAERAGHRPLGRVLDEDDGSRNWFHVHTEQQDRERRDRRPGERDVDPPEQLPGARAVDPGRLATAPAAC